MSALTPKADIGKATGIFSLSGSSSTDGTRGEKGTGLGLLLSKERVQRNGGEIYATSKPGKGSTFAFTVPKNAPAPKKLGIIDAGARSVPYRLKTDFRAPLTLTPRSAVSR